MMPATMTTTPYMKHLFWAMRRWIILTSLRLSARFSETSPAESLACSSVSPTRNHVSDVSGNYGGHHFATSTQQERSQRTARWGQELCSSAPSSS